LGKNGGNMAIQNKNPETDGQTNVTHLNPKKKGARKRIGEVKHMSFIEIMEKNKRNQERLKKDRNNANLAVVRVHKLKKP
jgi:hypothetical protein